MDRRSITADILDRISACTRAAEAAQGRPEKTGILVIDCAGDGGKSVAGLKKYGAALTVASQDSPPDIVRTAEEYDFIFAPDLTLTVAAKLTAGIQDEPCVKWMWALLWLGKNIYADMRLLDRCMGRQTENAAMLSMIDSCKRTLTAMGVIEVAAGDYVRLIFKKNEAQEQYCCKKRETKAESCCKMLIGRSLITECDIRSLKENITELTVDSGTIVTPLARDAMRSQGISLTRRQS